MSSGNPDCPCCKAQSYEGWSCLPELKSFAKDGCPYCSLLLEGILHLIPDIEARFGYDATFRFKNRRAIVVYADPNGSLGYHPNSEDVKLEYEFYTVGAYREPQPPGDTSSEASFEQARQWIQTCSTDHVLCGAHEPSSLPTRVLDLGDDAGAEPAQVKLLESHNQKELYISLSHSWGGEQPLTTTAATLDDRKAGIEFARLPKTFQDAVRITRRLGIRYLWIDSLCIIQDDAKDWQVEASRMASIYRNSWLTVSATSSSSPNSGCFKFEQAIVVKADDDDDDDDDPLNVLFPEATKLRQDLRLSLRFTIAHPDFGPFSRPQENKPFPLLNRAWAYQERLLAPRVLHFGPHEVFWECMQDLDCECGAAKWSGARNMGTYMSRDTSGQLPPKISHYAALHVGTAKKRQVDDTTRKQKLLSRWEDMVQEYSRRALTFPTDRLPAFSGVAAEMVDALGMKYRAGLWEETLPLGLLWERDNCIEIGPPMQNPRPAPSWSWAGIDAPVRFLLSLYGPYRAWDVPVVHAGVEEIRCIPSGIDERGQVRVKESYVILSAEMVTASLYFEPDSGSPEWTPWIPVSEAVAKGTKGPTELTRRSFMINAGQGDPVMFVPDIALCDKDGNWAWEEKDELYCAKILKSSDFWHWLVLRPIHAEGDSVYERIGVVQNSDADWGSNQAKQRIKII